MKASGAMQVGETKGSEFAVDGGKMQMGIDLAEKADCLVTRVPRYPNGMFAPADPPKHSVIACGRGFVGRRNHQESLQYFDMGGKWIDSFGGPPETICTRPFAMPVAAAAAIESDGQIGPEDAKRLEAALNERFALRVAERFVASMPERGTSPLLPLVESMIKSEVSKSFGIPKHILEMTSEESNLASARMAEIEFKRSI